MIESTLNINKRLQVSAERFFGGSDHNKGDVEVHVDKSLSILSITIYNKNSITPWLSIIEIKRFYDFCKNQNLVEFAYDDWYFSSISEYCNDFIKIVFHLKK